MGKRIKEYYISIDVESDGPCPGINSMLQYGAVFYDPTGKIIHEAKANILEIPGAVQDPETMKWWKTQEERFPGIWERMMENRVDAKLAMERFQSGVARVSHELNASPVCVAYPSGYDFTYLYYYLCRFLGNSCVGFSCIDVKTLSMTLLQKTYHNSSKKRMPRRWFDPKLKHTHDALDDAREQGYLFFQMLRDTEANWNLLDAAKTPNTAVLATDKSLIGG